MKQPDHWANFNYPGIDFQNIHYYVKPSEQEKRSWDEVPEEIKNTFDKLGIPEAERKYLAGVGAQFESEMVYHNLHETLAKKGVLTDVNVALMKIWQKREAWKS